MPQEHAPRECVVMFRLCYFPYTPGSVYLLPGKMNEHVLADVEPVCHVKRSPCQSRYGIQQARLLIAALDFRCDEEGEVAIRQE